MMVKAAIDNVFSRMATDTMHAAWTVPPRLDRARWCESNIRLPAETSAQPGLLELDGHAYMRGILNAVDAVGIRKITFMGGTQIGKTELLKAIMLSQGEIARAPMMFAGPDQDYVREQREVFYRTAEATPAIRGRVPALRFRNDRWIDLEKCLIYLAWSGSAQRLSGRACKIVLCSEADRWQRSPALAEERTKAFPGGGMVVIEGTPVGESPVLHNSYRQSDRRTFRVPCPVCGEYQELRFFLHKRGEYQGKGGVGGLQDDDGRWRTPEEARKSAYYICERHGCRIENYQKRVMVRQGIWARDGEHVGKDGGISGAPLNPCRHAGFRVNSLYSPTVSFGDAAEKYLLSRDDKVLLGRFFNDWLGLRFVDRGKTPKWRDLGQRLAGNYPRGVVPKAAYFLTCGADVHATNLEWSVRAWGDGKTSWLVDWGVFNRDLAEEADVDDDESTVVLASDIAKLDGLLDKKYPVNGENPLGHSSLAIRLMLIDCQYRQTDVCDFVRSHPGNRVRAVFGDPKITPLDMWRPSKTDRDANTGSKDSDGLTVWGIDTNAYKTEIADRWYADRRKPGAWWVPGDIFEQADGEDYLRQITAEVCHTKPGKNRPIWELISHGLANHKWDCEVYQCAGADMIIGVLPRAWDSRRWHPDAKEEERGDDQSPLAGAREQEGSLAAR